LNALAERLLDFQYYWESTAQPFEWKFTRQDLKELLNKFDRPDRNSRQQSTQNNTSAYL